MQHMSPGNLMVQKKKKKKKGDRKGKIIPISLHA